MREYHPPHSQLAGPGTPPGTTCLVRQRASLHAPFHFTLPFLHPCPLECSSYAVRPPTWMKAKNTTGKLATALPLAPK